MRGFLDDVRYAFRSLRRSPGLTLTVVGTLGLGIGALTTFFGFVNTSLYRPLPYHDADRKGYLWVGWMIKPSFIDEYMQSFKSLERMTMFEWDFGMLEANGEAMTARGASIDSGFFALAEPRVLLGTLPSSRQLQGGEPVAVISEWLWRNKLGGAPDVVGHYVTFKGQQRRVMAVIDGNFTIPDATEIWIPVVGSDVDPAEHSNWGLALLAPGVTRERVNLEFRQMTQRLRTLDPDPRVRGGYFMHMDERMIPLRSVGGLLTPMKILVAASLAIVLIASTNLALLMIARGARRRGEMVIRASVGASRWQLIRQQLAESLLLATGAGLAGTLLSVWGIRLFLRLMTFGRADVHFDGWLQWGIDWRVLGVGIGASVVAVTIFGLWPARASTRFDLADVLKSDGGYAVAGGDPTRSGHLPIVLQLVLSVVLFTIASTLATTYGTLSRADRGYQPRDLYQVRLTSDPRDTAPAAFNTFLRNMRDAINDAPGGMATVEGQFSDFNGEGLDGLVYLPGATKPVVGPTEWRADPKVVSDNFLAVVGLPLLNGRTFGSSDALGMAPVAVVSRTFAMHAWGTVSAVGKTIVIGHPFANKDAKKNRRSDAGNAKGKSVPIVLPTAIVIGVAEDRRYSGQVNGHVTMVARPEVYLSHRQAKLGMGGSSIEVRSNRGAAIVQRAVSRALSQVGRRVPIDVASAETQVAAESLVTQMLSKVLSVLAIVSLALALVGIYGIVAFSVQYRTREIGIRIALGAQGRDVARLILRGGAQLAAIGLGLGLVLAIGVMRLVASFVIGTLASQVLAAVGASALFGLVTLGASLVPARRAARMNPVDALRQS
jgi:putative ABC transport system permease protein